MHMIDGYKQTRKQLRALRTLNTNSYERGVLGGMISDCDYTLEWLSTGRRPGNRRGIERRAAYQREHPTPPELLHCPAEPPPRRMDVNDYNRLIQVLSILSDRERACFEMHHVGLWSEYEIADHLNITRHSVHEYLGRARRKIEKFISRPIQMELFPRE